MLQMIYWTTICKEYKNTKDLNKKNKNVRTLDSFCKISRLFDVKIFFFLILLD